MGAQKDNFCHLTGVHTRMKPKIFFDKCYNGTLQVDDFDFLKKGQNQKSVKGTVRRKIKILSDMMELFKDGLQAGEKFKRNRVVCSFATADGSCTLGFSESEKVRPKSLIKGNELKNPRSVESVLRRKAGTLYFEEFVIGGQESLEKYQEQILDMLSEELLEMVKPIQRRKR